MSRHCLMYLLLVAFLGFTHRLSLLDRLRIAGIISQWLVVTLHVVHTLPIFHDESPWSWNVLPTKNVLFLVIHCWSKFPANGPFIFSRTTQKRLPPSECNCYRWKPWNFPLRKFRNTAIWGGTSVTYLLNAPCIFI